MRIISKLQDYYDGYQNYNRKDRFNKVWVRKTKEVEVNINDVKIFEDRCIRPRLFHWQAGYFIIAGRVVPYLYRDDYGDVKYYFEPEEAYKDYNKKFTEEGYRWWNAPDYKDFKEFFRFIERYDELCIKVNSPLINIKPNSPYYRKERFSPIRVVQTNPNLKKLGATNIGHAATIYQSLNHFVSNVLVNDEMPETTPMTEKEKMQQHGFTHKYSFRKEPSK